MIWSPCLEGFYGHKVSRSKVSVGYLGMWFVLQNTMVAWVSVSSRCGIVVFLLLIYGTSFATGVLCGFVGFLCIEYIMLLYGVLVLITGGRGFFVVL
jgi:hypothetical protein